MEDIFPPGLTFLASVFWTFLPYFSDAGYLEEFTSPYLIKKNYWILHRRGIEPSIIVTVAQSVTSRPPILADIRPGSDILFIGSGNLYTLKTVAEIYTRHIGRL